MSQLPGRTCQLSTHSETFVKQVTGERLCVFTNLTHTLRPEPTESESVCVDRPGPGPGPGPELQLDQCVS